MVRPADAKVWNEDLVKALRARAEQKRQNGVNDVSFRKAAAAIEAVRQGENNKFLFVAAKASSIALSLISY